MFKWFWTIFSLGAPEWHILRLGRLCCVQSQLTNLSRIKEPHTDSTRPTSWVSYHGYCDVFCSGKLFWKFSVLLFLTCAQKARRRRVVVNANDFRSFSLSHNKKINWKPSGRRSQENEMCFKRPCRAFCGEAILVYSFGPPIWPPEINKNIWSSLFL